MIPTSTASNSEKKSYDSNVVSVFVIAPWFLVRRGRCPGIALHIGHPLWSLPLWWEWRPPDQTWRFPVKPHWKWAWEGVTWMEMSSVAGSDLLRKYDTKCCWVISNKSHFSLSGYSVRCSLVFFCCCCCFVFCFFFKFLFPSHLGFQLWNSEPVTENNTNIADVTLASKSYVLWGEKGA